MLVQDLLDLPYLNLSGASYSWKFHKDDNDQPEEDYISQALHLLKAILTGSEVMLDVYTNETTELAGIDDSDQLVDILVARGANRSLLLQDLQDFEEEGLLGIRLGTYDFSHEPKEYITTLTLTDLEDEPEGQPLRNSIQLSGQCGERVFRIYLDSQARHSTITRVVKR